MTAPTQPGYRARAEAAEQRVRQLEADVGTNADWGTEMQEARDKANAALAGVIQMAQDRADERDAALARAAAAEAREQALRDRVTKAVEAIEAELAGPRPYRNIHWALSLLSPPTADTEESDRG